MSLQQLLHLDLALAACKRSPHVGSSRERFRCIPAVAAFHRRRGAPRDQCHGAHPATIAAGTEPGHAKPSSSSSPPSNSFGPPPPPPNRLRCRRRNHRSRVRGEGDGEGDGMETPSMRWIAARSSARRYGAPVREYSMQMGQAEAIRKNWRESAQNCNGKF